MGFLHGSGLNAQSSREMPMYPGRIPNSRDVPDAERTEVRANKERFIYDTAIPTLTVFRPEHPNGKAVIICPGGGYRGVSIDAEGMMVARQLIEDSITAFVLKYRTPNDRTAFDKSLAPLQDVQQAMRHVRLHAADYIRSARIRSASWGFQPGAEKGLITQPPHPRQMETF